MGLAEITAVALAGASGWLLTGPGVAGHRLAVIAAPRERRGVGQAATVGRLFGRVRAAGARERLRAAATAEMCEGLAAELRAGRSPSEALLRAIEVTPTALAEEMRPTRTAAHSGGDVAASLWDAGGRPGAIGLRRLGVCFRVGAGAGGAFAPAVERLAGALRDEEAARQEVSAQLAGARATARLLAALPFLGTFLGFGLGVDPFGFWFGSLAGFGCLGAGVVLDALGVLWMRRLARAAELPR